MTDAQIKHMVDRFLSWRLPENFAPDAGISFKAAFNEHTAHPSSHKPVGTNLFDATQAKAMVRHMLGGLPEAPSTPGNGVDAELSNAAACRLSRAFNQVADLRDPADRRINEWLKRLIASTQLFRRDDEDPAEYQVTLDRAATEADAMVRNRMEGL